MPSIPPVKKSPMRTWPVSASNDTRSVRSGTTRSTLESHCEQTYDTQGTCFLMPPKTTIARVLSEPVDQRPAHRARVSVVDPWRTQIAEWLKQGLSGVRMLELARED